MVTENPQVEHISSQVNPPCVHKHGCKKRQRIIYGVADETAWNEGPPQNKSLTTKELDKEKQNVQSI